jgi:hypothetical protein
MLILLPGLVYICYHGIEKHRIALGARLAASYAMRSKRAELRAPVGGDVQ